MTSRTLRPDLDLRWAPFLTLTKKEIMRFTRVLGQTILIPLVNSTLYIMIFGVSLGQHIQVPGHTSYLAFLIPGLIMMGVINNAFQNSSSSIATSKFHGDLEDLRKSPLTPHQILWAMSVGGLVRGALVGIIVLLVGEAFSLVTTHSFLPIAHPFHLILFLTLGGLVFAQMGISIAFYSKSIDQLSAIGGFVLLPLMYLGGIFFSLEQLHPFWQVLSQVNPMLYFINGVRYGMLGQSDVPWVTSLGVASTALLIMHAVALRTVKFGSYTRW